MIAGLLLVACGGDDERSVGGTVTGLSGSGLVLSNNLSDDLAIDSNGAFVFATEIEKGKPFAVTVKTQPSNPPQTCVVANGTGTMGDDDVTNVQVTCTTNMFTVGGTVAGLTGTGLVLQNNGGDDISISSNGTFTFPTMLPSGGSYDVTVKTQPASQTCVVTNGAGTIANASVTNVNVTCTANAFAIQGMVTGLAGSGLVLQNDGGDNLSVTSNGAFSFKTPVATGAKYRVTVFAQPTSPTQVCTVTNGSGTVESSNVTNVVVTCVTSKFRISGTVSGLAGTGLVLTNNGGDNLLISANGVFTFSTRVASGATFNVAVAAQPSGPSQTCVVGGGQGTVGAGDVSSVTVNCMTNRFIIGGTITGLAGTVVLQNNGADNLTVTSNGTFAFAGTVASGGMYRVTVLTQPSSPSQICTVANSVGTVGSSNVTSVQVSCVTNRFSVSGTVSGLRGNGLVLANNGADALAIAADGTFTFPTQVASGTAFDVTVVAQPSGPTQVCTVTNGAGVIGASNVTGVTVTCVTSVFQIGGSVTGLVGAGLVLQNNGTDDVPVATDGPFVFPTPVASGRMFSVTVLGQPPGQTCTVTDGSGTVTTGNVNTVEVACTTNMDP